MGGEGRRSTFTDAQQAFYWERYTLSRTFTIRQLIEKHWEFDKDIVILFIDFEKTYDSIKRKKIRSIKNTNLLQV